MLKQRILTAFVLIVLVLLALLLLPEVWFALLTAAIMIASAWEWSRLMGLISIPKRVVYLICTAMVFFGALLVPQGLILIVAAVTWLIPLYFVFNYEEFQRFWSVGKLVPAITGIWILLACWLGLNLIRIDEEGPSYLLLLLLLVWGADTGAYFAGKRFGKHKLAPQISPGKTVEGMIGGTVAVLIVALIGSWLLPMDSWQRVGLIVLSVLTGFVSLLGDLFESMVKRQIGVKDSGQWLPGHGGLLYRIDSLIAAAPIFALGLLILRL